MTTEYPTSVCIEAETDAGDQAALDRLRTPVLLGSYGVLWLAFILGGTFVAVTMAGLVAGLLDGILLTALGLGAVAAGPDVARRTVASVPRRVE